MPKKTASPGSTGDRTPTPKQKTPSFLSILKAVHKTTKLYVSLILLMAGIPGAILYLAQKFGASIWAAIGLAMLPAVLILLWLVPTWRAERNKRDAEYRGIHGQIKDSAYFRLTPYDSASDFRRADNMHEKIYAWLVGNPAPLLYLSGASGSGKSSIISAWCCPNWSVIPSRRTS